MLCHTLPALFVAAQPIYRANLLGSDIPWVSRVCWMWCSTLMCSPSASCLTSRARTPLSIWSSDGGPGIMPVWVSRHTRSGGCGALRKLKSPHCTPFRVCCAWLRHLVVHHTPGTGIGWMTFPNHLRPIYIYIYIYIYTLFRRRADACKSR